MGSTLFANIDFPYVNSGVTKLMRSTDTGKTWTDVGSEVDAGPGGFIDNLTLASDGNNVYAATAVALYRSSDLGQTWTNLSGALIQGENAITANELIYLRCFRHPNVSVDRWRSKLVGE